MKEGFRQSMAWLHTWSGLVVGWILFAVFVTGTLSYFRPEISQWMRPELRDMQPHPQAAASAIAALQQRAPDSPRWFIRLPDAREPIVRVTWRDPNATGPRRFQNAVLDPATGAEVKARDTRGGDFFYRFHFELSMKPIWGRWVVGCCAMFMLIAIVTGVITHKKIFKDFFTFRPKKGQRSWLDAHNVVGVLALPYHVMITYSGLVTLMFMYMPWGVQANYGQNRAAFFDQALGVSAETPLANRPGALTNIEPLLLTAQRHWDGANPSLITVHNPADANSRIEMRRDNSDRLAHSSQSVVFAGTTGELLAAAGEPMPATRTRDVVYGLHMANFSSSPLRWLFALSGLAGILMIASGLVLWSVKRAPERVKLGRVPFGQRLVEVLNIGVIAGLPITIAVFFHANRLLPIGLAERPTWEVRAFFAAWLLSFVVPLIRPAKAAWKAQFLAAATLFGALPVVNALTTDAHLGVTLASRNWVYAGFDLTCLGIAALLGLIAWHASRTSATQRKPARNKAETPANLPAEAERA
ncbi:PepSY domain-containing protein [Steroidobacter sp. S1-65]|uniref:PepSY domain-containing protein n=1 Tax=Steroidobacter gossypii TaxID=2805490 RepID=A0ABS1X2M4_9GAMM|nr:PepSY-associated TM helix domain-containing protein [Steroidobacter gossypii]MBM0107467.1 PepSY domain-containing protein [Steroidobacter gossypii]